LFLLDERLQRLVAAGFIMLVGLMIGLGVYHANGAEMDGQFFGQSILVVLAFTFAMRSSQEFRESRERQRRRSTSARPVERDR
jgi:hypothetical protein